MTMPIAPHPRPRSISPSDAWGQPRVPLPQPIAATRQIDPTVWIRMARPYRDDVSGRQAWMWADLRFRLEIFRRALVRRGDLACLDLRLAAGRTQEPLAHGELLLEFLDV